MEEINIHNKIYNITYSIDYDGNIYVKNFSINYEHQGKHRNYSKRIFNNLLKKHNAEMLYGECMYDLIPFYEKIGFIRWSKSPNWWGGYEVHLYKKVE